MVQVLKVSFAVSAAVVALGAFALAERFKPVSATDRARVENLLKSFDPNSFEVQLPYLDAQGKLRKQNIGRAKGLASLIQSNTKRPGQAANSDSIIPMVTVTAKGHIIAGNGVVFAKEGFGKAALANKVRELNTILKKYYVAQ